MEPASTGGSVAMSLRLRLALAFVLLSALPLGAFAAYSYLSSKAALRAAAHAEAEATARELEQRVADATSDIDRRLRSLSTVPIGTWLERSENGDQVAPQIAELDQALPYLEGLRFVADVPAPPEPPSPSAASSLPVPPTPPVAPSPAAAAVAPAAPAPPVPAPPAASSLPSGFSSSREPAADAADMGAMALRSIHIDDAHGAFVIEVAKLQKAALDAVAATAKMKGKKLGEMGLESMAAHFEEQAKAIEKAAQDRARAAEGLAEGAAPSAPKMAARVEVERAATSARAAAAKSPKSSLAFSVSDNGRVVGQLRAKIKGEQLFQSVLARVDRRQGEIPFGLGEDHALIAASDADAKRLESIPALAALRGGSALGIAAGAAPADGEEDWIVVSRKEPATGYQLGIARPLSGSIAQLKRAVARNLTLGLALVGLATVGFFPLTSRFVRDVRELDRGAARIAGGDLTTRVAVAGRDELGRLGASFNRMAEQIATHQEQLLVEERKRKEEEISRRLLAAENDRRGRELEEAREFQLSLLPRELPKIAGLDLAVEMTTATEVGGDYYDFQIAPDGALVLAIGDATGHGATAGTLVTAVKSLFAAAVSADSPAAFLVSANAAIHRMGLVRRAMALAVARIRGENVVISSAGMPPTLHFRAAAGEADELVLPGTPLGSRAECPYSEVTLALAPGDALLFVSDGLPELPNGDGEPFGYERLKAEFERLASSSACEIVSGLRAAARDWAGDRPPVDDVTLLAVRRA